MSSVASPSTRVRRGDPQLAIEPNGAGHFVSGLSGPGALQMNEYLLCENGLGLTICQRLLQAMDSPFEVETRPDQGTLFHFELDLPLAGPRPVARGEITTVPSPVRPAVSASAH